MNAGTCELCDRVAWRPLALIEGRWVHPCCVVEIERWGLSRCGACDIADRERRRWERRLQERRDAL